MKYSLRKSFSYRRRKETHDDDHVYPRLDANGYSNSNSNLVKTAKSRKFLHRQRRSSSPIPSDQIKSKVFEPRYDIYSNDENENDDDPFASATTKTRPRPFDRLTNQIRKSFRNTLSRPRPRLESNNSNKRLIPNKNDAEQHTQLYPMLSTGLTSPLIKPEENEKPKRRKAPLAPTHMNQSISCPTEINPDHQQTPHTSDKTPFRKRFSFLRKKPQQTCPPDDVHDEQSSPKLTLGQRFDTLRRSFRLGNRQSSHKGQRYLLSNE
ncbi:unnamed protein product [Adineta ricciae]|uniref:Uncharacterized protein n=1 Tax=Adineta ricciae TaxID=249248 RepID=A0A815LU55_ADIRI|nr:unnamed protein product [Adineta ricciae]